MQMASCACSCNRPAAKAEVVGDLQAFAGAQAKGLLPASDAAAEPVVNCLLAHVCL